MKNLLCFSAALTTLALSFAASSAPALAGDPGYCSGYAESAVREFYRAAHAGCPGIGGPRWHGNYAIHYNWCLQSSYGSINSEWNARRETLHACSW